MKRLKCSAIATVLLAVSLAASPLIAFPQRAIENPFSVEPNRYLVKWDPFYNTLIFYRDVADTSTPAVRTYTGGISPNPLVYPLKDFPDAKKADIWDVAATPSGGAAVICVLGYAKRPAKHAILIYDRGGSLQKVLETYPYHHHRIVVDLEENIYAFGHRLDIKDEPGEPDYAVLVKYSQDGKVLARSLPRTWYPAGFQIAEASPATGEHALLVVGRELVLYLSTAREVLRFNTDGELLVRTPFTRVLDEIIKATESARAEVVAIGSEGTSHFVVELRLWPKDSRTGRISFLLAKLSQDGTSWKRDSSVATAALAWRFLGLTDTGRLAFLTRGNAGEILFASYDAVR